MRRGVYLDGVCLGCGFEGEDLFHVLLQCPFARLMWAMSNLQWSSISCPHWFRKPGYADYHGASTGQDSLVFFSSAGHYGVPRIGCCLRTAAPQPPNFLNEFGGWSQPSLLDV
ncbi:UNVERIFIED_CONTAM: hypothetical protein Slati_2458800 [Sesamum latifolium]|uniref:Reverse transcriptase zinc-binding domain-containing protein n=1 Tax=Sesamum latifolium TaxID=2727402 RepID=A0AAW2WEJ6_9LAMI